MQSTSTLVNILENGEVLQRYINNVGKILLSLLAKPKDLKLFTPYKFCIKSLVSRLEEEEYEVKWDVANRL